MAFKKTKRGVEMDYEGKPSNQPRFGKSSPKASAIEAAGHEIKDNPTDQLKKTAKKFGKKRARAQKVVVMLNKARKGD